MELEMPFWIDRIREEDCHLDAIIGQGGMSNGHTSGEGNGTKAFVESLDDVIESNFLL
jgi:ribulose 1,5-bisphosphate carboxylase large subunit-like protein